MSMCLYLHASDACVHNVHVWTLKSGCKPSDGLCYGYLLTDVMFPIANLNIYTIVL